MTPLASQAPNQAPNQAPTQAPNRAPNQAPTQAPAQNRLLRTSVIAAGVLLVFGGFSLWVIAGHGLLGFLTLAGEEPWALQLLLDLAISLSFALSWLAQDARKHGITAWPFQVTAIFAGSFGLLGYLIWRGIAAFTSAAGRASRVARGPAAAAP